MVHFIDICRFWPASAGDADWEVDAAVQGYLDDLGAGALDGEEYRLRSESADLTQWEIATGVYDAATRTFARTVINYSSNAGAKVDYATLPQVAIVVLAADLNFPRGFTGDGPPDEDVADNA